MNPPKVCSRTSNQCPWTERYLTGASVATVSLCSLMAPVRDRRHTSAMHNPGWLWSCHLQWCHARTSGRNHTGLVKGPWASLSSPRKQSTSVTSPISQTVGVLVSSGCYYKNHRQGVLNNRNVSSPSSEGLNPRSRYQQGWFLLRSLSLNCRWPSSPYVLTWSSPLCVSMS